MTTPRQLVHINVPVSKRFDIVLTKQAKLAGKSKSAFIRDKTAEGIEFKGDPSPFGPGRKMSGSAK